MEERKKDFLLYILEDALCDDTQFFIINEYLDNHSEDRIYMNDTDGLEDMLEYTEKSEIVRAISFGQYSWTDSYVKFNGYGNIKTFNELWGSDGVWIVDMIAWLTEGIIRVVLTTHIQYSMRTRLLTSYSISLRNLWKFLKMRMNIISTNGLKIGISKPKKSVVRIGTNLLMITNNGEKAMSKKRDFETDYVKAVKKIMREEIGLTPTRVEKSKKAYNRQKSKRITDTDDLS